MSDKMTVIDNIQNRIFTIRNMQVMIDRDLAELYQVETKALNQVVKRNINRFPGDFHFQLSKTERQELVTNCDRFLIIDDKTVYRFGASLKDLGKKWFAFFKINIDAGEMINKLK